MHKRTKNILLGTAGLAVTLAPGILASSQPVVLSGLTTVAKAAEVTNLDVTGTIANTDPQNIEAGYAHRDNVKLNIKTKNKVASGNTIRLTGQNLNLWLLHDKQVKLPDGTVVGNVKVLARDYIVQDSKKVEVEQVLGFEGDTIPDALKKVKSTDYLNYDAVITFNDKAATYQNLDISLDLQNVRTLDILSTKEADIPVKLLVNDKVVAERTHKRIANKVRPGTERIQVLSVDGLNNAYNTDKGITGSYVNIGIHSDKDQPLRKGDRFTFKLKGGESSFLFKPGASVENLPPFKEGQVFKKKHGRSAEQPVVVVNEDGVILQRNNPVQYKVVSITPDTAVVEILSDSYLYENVEVLIPTTIIKNDYDAKTNKIKGGSIFFTADAKEEKNKLNQFELKPNFTVIGAGVGAGGVKIQTKTTQWADVDSKESLKPSKIGEAFEPAGTVSGYTFVRSEVSKDGAVTTHLFKKDAEKPEDEEIVTSFLEEGSGEKLKDPVKAEKEAEPGTIEGYQFVRTERKGREVTHWFKKKEEPKKPETKQPNTRYVDEDGKVIEEVPGSQDKKDIPGYTYLRTEKDKDGNITHVYHKIVTRFVTDKGVTLKQVDGAQPKEEIEGYEFVETKTDEKTGDVTHVYREVTPTAEPFTILKDDKGNVLKTTKGTHDPEDLPGYRYLRTEKDKDGNTVHIYHRIVTSFVTVKDGKEEVLKSKDGAQPKEDIEGYEFVETKTDEKLGDIKHFYKAKVLAGAEKKAPVQTAGSAGLLILPAAAVLGLGGLVAGLARRKNN